MFPRFATRPTADNAGPRKPLPPCGCDQDPVEGLKQLFVDYFQGADLAQGRDPATRPVFLRLHGVAYGTFAVREDLPEDLRVGVFGQRSEYPVWVRFSSDVQPGNPDYKGTIGIGIKLFGVEGEKIMPPDQGATTQDFILQNHDVFFVDTAKDMCEFTCQSINGRGDEYLAKHPVTNQILNDMEKVVDTVLGSPYWSVLPSRFGEHHFVKYKLEPELVPSGDGQPPDFNDPFYLRADLHQRLRSGEARIRFFVQFQKGAEAMPLDRATVRWSEEASPPVHVATLILPRQDLDTRGQSAYGENLAFNTWHALPEHEPVGSLAQARKVVYRASAEVRRDFNGVPLGEPVEPRPSEWKPGEAYPHGVDTTVVRAAIHPAIGIARVGNSLSEYFIGPEVTEPLPEKPGFYRDGEGALKRQAARFRIYGYNAEGKIVQELTPDTASIQWTVHVANRKASWYQWQMALDIPEAATLALPLRNANVTGKNRESLDIDGGPRMIEGKGTQGSAYEFRGKFQGVDVYLGELRTDEDGNLLFLGGRGESASPSGTAIFKDDDPNSFINADGWYDDVSDGPVTATVNIEGRNIPVEPAWVATAPPNYGPGVKGVRTLYDLLFDLFSSGGWFAPLGKVSFRKDVYPILERLSGLQWSNKGFATQFGKGGPNDFTDPAYVARLAMGPTSGGLDPYAELRLQVLHCFRDPQGADNNQLPWPWIYGDAMDVPPANTPRQNAAISSTQYSILVAWAAGMFEADWSGESATPHEFKDVPLQDQPAMLDRAALEFCLADAFHPGCEVTWPIRHLTMFSAPYRIRHASPNEPEPNYGSVLTQSEALSNHGPLHAQGPGGITRWMGLPWQADTGYCRSGYPATGYFYDAYIPTFWPARVPNQVLTEENYRVVIDTNQPREERLAKFHERMDWNLPLKATGTDTAHQMEEMVRIFGDMGLLEVRPGVEGDPDFPATMMVATFGAATPSPAVYATLTAAPALDHYPKSILRQRSLRESGSASQEEAERAPLPVRHPR